ncbi:hypothetical protein [Naasia sp. SYSU D00057]|uniref:hypothetical protein n=1 Tax=Naasia sp. SYSU D00057 TaxID=2817380 RepID=UPI001B307580|nr:hypothetical protein [Naasia sp. SYSU D00057]
MQLYSVSPLVRSRQIVSDLLALAVVVGSTALGITVGLAFAALGRFGRSVEEAGAGLQRSMSDAASTLEDLPVVGSAVSAPFRDASGVGASLVASGQEQQRLMTTLGIVAGLLVALLPIALVLTVWLRRRLAFVRRARRVSALAASPAGLELLALRALAGAPSPRVVAAAPDAVEGWRRGDPEVVRALADLELRAAGVRR